MNAFETLGLRWDADQAQVHAAYRSRVKGCHPDQFQDQAQADQAQEQLIRLNLAYEEALRIAAKRQIGFNTVSCEDAKTLARKLMEQGRNENALRQLARADSKDAQWYCLQGEILMNLHQYDSAHQSFREAVRRAVRQGLEQAESLLLEPVYDFRADLPAANLGRLMADMQKFSGVFDPPLTEGGRAVLTGRAPVSELMRYQSEVQAYTRGAGYLSLRFGGYEVCHDAQAVIEAAGYARAADGENPSESIFCAHGAGFAVPWFEIHRFIPPYKRPLPPVSKEDE